MKYRLMFHSLIFLGLVACGNDNSNDTTNTLKTPEQQIAQLEKNGDIPVLDRSDSLAGPDIDQNGIRDDIDAYIEKNYKTEGQKKAARQFARKLQRSFTIDIEDMTQVKAVSLEGGRAISCIFKQFPEGELPEADHVVDNLISITTNTKARLKAYLAYDKKLDGTVSSIPSGDVCDEN